MAFSDTEIVAYSSEVVIQYWTYASVPKGYTYEEYINGQQPSSKSSVDDEKRAEIPEEKNMETEENWAVETLISKLIENRQEEEEKTPDKVNDFLVKATDFMSSQMATQIATLIKSLQESGTLATITPAQIFQLVQTEANKAGEKAAEEAVNNFQTEEDKTDEEDDDGEFDCVPMTQVPTIYRPETPMQLRDGICGYKFQLINVNKEFGFSFNVLRDNAFFALSASSALLASAIAFF